MKIFNKIKRWFKRKSKGEISMGSPPIEAIQDRYGEETGTGLLFMPVPYSNSKITVLPRRARNPLKSLLSRMENKAHTVEFILLLIKEGKEHGFQVFVQTTDKFVIPQISSHAFWENGVYRSEAVDFSLYDNSPFLETYLSNLN